MKIIKAFFALLVAVSCPFQFALAGKGCKGIVCGISECCNPSSQRCVTPPGFKPSYCSDNGRRLLPGSQLQSQWVSNIRIGFVKIVRATNITNNTNNTINSIVDAMDGRIVKVEIVNSETSNKKDKKSAGFFKTGRTLSALLISAHAYETDHVAALEHSSSTAKQNNTLLTSVAFCPIDNGNVAKLGVRILSPATLFNLQLDVIVAKHDVIMETHTNYHLMAVVGSA